MDKISQLEQRIEYWVLQTQEGDKDRRLRATSTLNLLKNQYKELTGKHYTKGKVYKEHRTNTNKMESEF